MILIIFNIVLRYSTCSTGLLYIIYDILLKLLNVFLQGNLLDNLIFAVHITLANAILFLFKAFQVLILDVFVALFYGQRCWLVLVSLVNVLLLYLVL